jgi:hypothetical protein
MNAAHQSAGILNHPGRMARSMNDATKPAPNGVSRLLNAIFGPALYRMIIPRPPDFFRQMQMAAVV